ncbi:MAG TPA: nickel insertion protein, partial [Actinomycetota bacterium]|nr:nickel insertion protein [Actinomycetota bacterium]
MTVLFLDCFSGVAGDMFLGALLDAGAPLQDVTQSVDALALPGWSLRVEEVRRAGIRATRAEVDVEDSGEARPYGRVKR